MNEPNSKLFRDDPATYYAELGAQAERERIIKLLQEWGEDAGCFCCASDVAASEIIALIKGEANE